MGEAAEVGSRGGPRCSGCLPRGSSARQGVVLGATGLLRDGILLCCLFSPRQVCYVIALVANASAATDTPSLNSSCLIAIWGKKELKSLKELQGVRENKNYLFIYF